MRILILKPSSLGDVIQALPVLRALKLHFPAAEIHWWIDRTLAPLLEADPDLSGLVLFERRHWAAPTNLRRLGQDLIRLRELSFDWVIDLQSLARSAIFGWVANGRLFVGLDEPREGARGFYDLVVPRPSFHTHAVDWYLGVLELLGVPRAGGFCWLPPRAEVAAALAARLPSSLAGWVVLQPGARWRNKRWPAEHYAALAKRLAGWRPDLRFAVTGSLDDRPLAEAILRAGPEGCLDLTGRLSLPEMVEAVRGATLMITNDTGPMHVAAAVGTPLVALFGPTDPRRTGPYGGLAQVVQGGTPCVPCLKARCAWPEPEDCLRSLGPEVVFAAVQKRLALPRAGVV